mgnify:CR=1 FL=1
MTQVKFINKNVLKKALSNGKQLALNNSQMTSCKANFQAKVKPFLNVQVDAAPQPVQEPVQEVVNPVVQDTIVQQPVMEAPVSPVKEVASVVDTASVPVEMTSTVSESAPVINPIEMNAQPATEVNVQPAIEVSNDTMSVAETQPVVMESPAPVATSEVQETTIDDSDKITREVMQLNVEMSKKIDEEIKMVNKRIAEITSEYNNKIITLTNELISKKKMKASEEQVPLTQNVSTVNNVGVAQPVMNDPVQMVTPVVSNSNNVIDFANYSGVESPSVATLVQNMDASNGMVQNAEGPTLNLKIS